MKVLKPGTLCLLISTSFKENLGAQCTVVEHRGQWQFRRYDGSHEGFTRDAYLMEFPGPIKGISNRTGHVTTEKRMTVARSSLFPLNDPDIDTSEPTSESNDEQVSKVRSTT
jgi:hypothetical protein